MIALALAAMAQTATQAPCLKDGDTVEGEFRYVESRHPNGTRLRQPFVVTDTAFCFVPVLSPETSPVRGRWIQVHWTDPGTRPPAPGDGVTVVLGSCQEPMTAWHTGDIFCDARLVSRVTQ